MVQQAAHEYLTAWVVEIGGKDRREAKVPGSGWFGRRRYILREAQIDLEPVTAEVATIEQGILACNDFTQNSDLLDEMAMQSEEHRRKYQLTVFADPQWATEPTDSTRLRVTRESRREVVDAVQRFCE